MGVSFQLQLQKMFAAFNMHLFQSFYRASWGDGGYCYVPYEYIMSKENLATDPWVIQDVED